MLNEPIRFGEIVIFIINKLIALTTTLGVANGKSETRRDAETGILKSEPETKKRSNLIENQIFDRQTQNLRLRDPVLGYARFQDLGRIWQDVSFFRGKTPNFTSF